MSDESQYGKCLRLYREEKYDESIKTAKRELKGYNYFRYYDVIGFCYRKKEDYEKAIVWFSKSYKLYGGCTAYHRRIAVLNELKEKIMET